MACFLDPDGLFNGDRIAKLSLMARLYWPYFFAAANCYGRLELNYIRLAARIFSRFPIVPSEQEVASYLKEYANNYLLFIYQAKSGFWGQFDTTEKYLPKYKTRASEASPDPGPAFIEWKLLYSQLKEKESLSNPLASNVFENVFPNVKMISEPEKTFPRAIAIAIDKTTCASDHARADVWSIDDTPFETTEPGARFPVEPVRSVKPIRGMTPQQETWFSQWWAAYWLRRAKKAAHEAFRKKITTEERFKEVMAATLAQKPEMLTREQSKRPHGATWIYQERYEDEVGEVHDHAEPELRRRLM